MRCFEVRAETDTTRAKASEVLELCTLP